MPLKLRSATSSKRLPLRINYAFVALVGAILFGTLGFLLIERWSLIDSLYTAVIIVTTVGYGEVRPLSPQGRLFTILFMLVGVGTSAYALSSVVQSLVQSGVVAA